MLRVLPLLLALALTVYCFIDCIQTPGSDVRNLPKAGWILLIVLFNVVGSVAWLVAGRPARATAGRSQPPWPATRTSGSPEHERPRRPPPDDDPEFLGSLPGTAPTPDDERLLRQWEEDLRRRGEELEGPPPERELRPDEPDGDQPPPDAPPTQRP